MLALVKSVASIGAGAVLLLAGWTAYRKARVRFSSLHAIPSPDSESVFFGHYNLVMNVKKVGEQYFRWMLEYGLIYRLDMFVFGERVIIGDPEGIKRVLISNVGNYPKPENVRRGLRALIGDGLLTSEGPDHTRQRRIISSAFHYDCLARISPIFAEKANELADVWLDTIKRSGEAHLLVDMKRALHSLTIDIIGLSAFGRDFGSVRGEHDNILAAYEQILGGNNMTISTVLSRMWPFRLLPLPKKLRDREAQKFLHAEVGDIIAQRRRARSAAAAAAAAAVPEPTPQPSPATNGHPSSAVQRGPDLLELMLRASDDDKGDGGTPPSGKNSTVRNPDPVFLGFCFQGGEMHRRRRRRRSHSSLFPCHSIFSMIKSIGGPREIYAVYNAFAKVIQELRT